jgi:hypothetical protein
MYMHDPVALTDIGGSGINAMITTGGVGDGGFHVHGMCRCSLAGGCAPTGSPVGDPIANGWYHNVDWGGENKGDILLLFSAIPAGEYELISYHNHWEPCSQATRNCLDCTSQMPNMPAIAAQSLPPAPLPGYGWAFPPGPGTGVTPIQNAFDIDVNSVLSDELVSTSRIRFETDGSPVLVIYDGGDNTYPDPARPDREGSKAILNAFELRRAKVDIQVPTPCGLYSDTVVDWEDVRVFVGNWLWSGRPLDNSADFNLDGRVDFADYAILALQWLAACPQ